MVHGGALMDDVVGLHQFFSWGPSRFYERPDRWCADSPDVAVGESGKGWVSQVGGMWVYHRPTDGSLPPQGWKIHVSATASGFEKVCEVAAGVCRDRRVQYKVLRDRHMHLVQNSKYAPRGGSGKVVTIYPADADQLVEIVDALDGALGDLPGPRILSDKRVGAGPVHVRYGAFRATWRVTASGELVQVVQDGRGDWVPDQRRPGFRLPAGIELPGELAARLGVGGSVRGLPFTIDGALHFSNAGGVYTAHRPDGSRLIVKEARPHAGLDLEGDDAVARSHAEERALRAAEGVVGVPRLTGVHEVDGHRYLALEPVPGDMLWRWQGRNNPLIWPVHDVAARRAHAERSAHVLRQVSDIVGELHAREVAHRDIHPSNIMVDDDDRVHLIDFEAASTGRGVHELRRAMGSLGFVPRRPVDGYGGDRFALHSLHLWMHLPLSSAWAHQPVKTVRIAQDACALFGLPPDHFEETCRTISGEPGTVEVIDRGGDPAASWPTGDSQGWPQLLERVWAAVEDAATPHDPERLFPGDIRLFARAEASLAFGAAGVLWAQAACGREVAARHVDWLLSTVLREGPQAPGLMTGLAGSIPLFLQLDDAPTVRLLADRLRDQMAPVTAPDLWSGLSGIGLSLLRAASVLGRWDEVAAIARRVAAAVRRVDRAERPGLFHGLSGAAMFLAAAGRALDRPGFITLAAETLEREACSTERTATGTRQVVQPGRRTLAYLEQGSAGIAIASVAVPGALAGQPSVREELLHSCRSEFVVEPGLLMGRAGLLLAVAAAGRQGGLGLPDHREVVGTHLRRLAWHALGPEHAIEFPGSQGFRVSMDLATGGAGIALAVTAALDERTPLLPFLPLTDSSTLVDEPTERSNGGEPHGDR